jgi:alkylated DNA nucleotide flippase Atl1
MSIEHILPQSLSKSAEMEFSETVDESKDVTQVHEEVVNLIGNLTLTNYNSELSNKPFSRKRSEWLAKTSVIENHEIAKKEEWGEKEIIARCEDIAAMVCELWVGPNEKLVDSEPISSGQRIDNLVGKIPEGKWASYGDIAEVVGTSNQAVGQRLAKSQADGAWRVLRVNGQVAPGFKWDSYSEYSGKDPIQVLEEEGLVFDETGSASPDQKISLEELFELQYQSED